MTEPLRSVALVARRDRELAQKTAVVGPHRDDLTIQIAGRPARTHGSQGQWRTAAVSVSVLLGSVVFAMARMVAAAGSYRLVLAVREAATRRAALRMKCAPGSDTSDWLCRG